MVYYLTNTIQKEQVHVWKWSLFFFLEVKSFIKDCFILSVLGSEDSTWGEMCPFNDSSKRICDRLPKDVYLLRPWCWERLKAGGEGDNRGWDGWRHWLKGHESEQAPGDGEGQGSLACFNSGSCKGLDKTGLLKNNPRTQEYANFPRKGDVADVIQVILHYLGGSK